jgi:hypothetical protein
MQETKCIYHILIIIALTIKIEVPPAVEKKQKRKYIMEL